MKARINRNKNNSPKKIKTSSGIDVNRLSLPDKIKFYQAWVEEDYYATVKMYENVEDVKSSDILIEFMHDRYLDEFPKSARQYIMSKVASMMNERLTLSLDDVIEIECAKRGISKRSAVQQIKDTEDFISCIFPEKDIPEYFKEKMQNTIDTYVKNFEEKHKDDVEDIEIDSESNVEEANVEENAENVVSENEETIIRNEEIASENETSNIYAEDTEKQEIQEEKIIEDELEKSEEEKFIDTVMLFTNNYDFLAENVEEYKARKGHRNNKMPVRTVIADGTNEGKVVIAHNPIPSIKFKSVDDATKFIRIQNIIRKLMVDNKNSEETALNRIVALIDEKGKKCKNVESNNLKALRKARLENIFGEMDINKEDQEFIKTVLKPICTSRLEVINREKQINGDEIEK